MISASETSYSKSFLAVFAENPPSFANSVVSKALYYVYKYIQHAIFVWHYLVFSYTLVHWWCEHSVETWNRVIQ